MAKYAAAVDQGTTSTRFMVFDHEGKVVCFDQKEHEQIYPRPGWVDTPTDQICNELAREGGQDRFRDKVGLPLATYFSGPKVRWMLDNVDGLRAAAERGDAVFGNLDTFVIWHLTGGPDGGAHVT